MFENQCNQYVAQGWEVILMVFNDMMVQVLLYGVDVGNGTTSLSALNEIENIKKIVLARTIGS